MKQVLSKMRKLDSGPNVDGQNKIKKLDSGSDNSLINKIMKLGRDLLEFLM